MAKLKDKRVLLNGTDLRYTEVYRSVAPAVTDDSAKGFMVGSRWIFGNRVYVNTSVARGAAVWAEVATKKTRFKSTEQTGTGSSQNIAHGLGAVPSFVWIVPTIIADGGFSIAEGAHDATNIKVTVTTGGKFYALAWL